MSNESDKISSQIKFDPNLLQKIEAIAKFGADVYIIFLQESHRGIAQMNRLIAQ